MNTLKQVDNKFNSIGMYIFGGSQTLGHLQIGWNVDRILEMTDDMTQYNAYHFTKNYPNIPIINPSEWGQPNYLYNLRQDNYDLLFSNNPCSGLSSINRNANSSQPINKRFYEVFTAINVIRPKTFLIENAPTLITIGTPILQYMVDYLGDNYSFTIIRDMAGNHGVPMKRQRTFVIGWRKDIFNNKIPIIRPNKKKETTIKMIFEGLSKDIPNMDFEKDTINKSLQRFYNRVKPKDTILRAMVRDFNDINGELDEFETKLVKDYIDKKNQNKNIWDKTAYRLDNDSTAPSMTSMAQFIHPTEDRELYIREYARIMGYPDDFIFYPDECKCSTIQCLAQGVPVNFIKYISKEIKRCLEQALITTNGDYILHNDVVFQHHSRNKLYAFSKEEFKQLDNLGNINISGVNI